MSEPTAADPRDHLVNLVREMRRWQREFAAADEPAARAAARERAWPLEREVDRLLGELAPPAAQATLFDTPPGPGAYPGAGPRGRR